MCGMYVINIGMISFVDSGTSLKNCGKLNKTTSNTVLFKSIK